MRKTGLSMYENKACSSYLGIVIGEKICEQLFPDVQVMSPTNPGYDFICKGYKVDVKSGILIEEPDRNRQRWRFNINKNIAPDYFICIGFDNRIDLVPLHIWVIPGKDINHMDKIRITNTNSKYFKYERPIEEVQMCCELIKETENGETL